MLYFALAVALQAPLQFGSNVPENLDNTANQQVKCIMQQLERPYEAFHLPYLRARQELRLQRIDGYYTAILLNELAPFGQLSAPLYLENWYWFELTGESSVPRAHRQHGVIRGSHQATWFAALGITPTVEVNTADELLQLLKRKRIESVLMDLETFEETAKRVGLPAENVTSEFFRYVPLGMYFSSALIQRSPQLLIEFNNAIPGCSRQPFTLSAREQQRILQRFEPALRVLADTEIISQAVEEANQHPWSNSQIIDYDNQWSNELRLQISGLAATMKSSALSQQLAVWQQQFNGQIAEIMLTDAQGRNIAVSELTSDYWQGDEAKFQQLTRQNVSYYFDHVSFDHSSQRFLVHLSLPLYGTDGNLLAALILGLDVELSLQPSECDVFIASCE